MAIKKDTLDQLLDGRDPKEVSTRTGFRRAEEGACRACSQRRTRRPSRKRGPRGAAEPSQRVFEEDRSDRDREARHPDSPRSGRDVRSEADRPVSAPLPRLRREDRVDVCARHDHAGDSGPPHGALWARGLPRSDLDGDGRGSGDRGGMAEPSAGGELPARLLRRHAGQDPRRGHGPQQGSLHRPRRPGGRHQGHSRPVDREHRRCQVLAARHERTQEPGRRRHSHRRCRWPEGIPRSDQRRLPGDDHPNLRRASDPAFAGVRLVERSKAWRRNWDRVIPFFAFPEAVRRIIYTTNAIEALNAKLRRAVKIRGHFPNDEAATKLIYLVLRQTAAEWKMSPREWDEAKTQFAIMFEDRFVLA